MDLGCLFFTALAAGALSLAMGVIAFVAQATGLPWPVAAGLLYVGWVVVASLWPDRSVRSGARRTAPGAARPSRRAAARRSRRRAG